MVENSTGADGWGATIVQQTIAVQDKTLAYGEGLTFKELVREALMYGELMAGRFAETRLTSAQQALVTAFPDFINIATLVTEEDPDTMAVLPVVARLLDNRPRLQLRVFCDDRDLSPLAQLLPDVDLGIAVDDWDLPMFFLFDDEWELQAQWGPRPAEVDTRLDAWLNEHPEYDALADDETLEGQARYAALADKLIYEMRLWYNSGLTATCLEEWQDLLTSLLSGDEGERVEE